MTNSTDEIKVSVRLTSYKQAHLIRKCLDSILCQKVNFRYEIVVGDDQSNDGTVEILEEYEQKHQNIFNVVVNEKNLGVTQNILSLDARLRGEYVCQMESDDFWVDPNRLQKQVDFLDAHPDYSAVGGNHYEVDPSGKNPRLCLMRWQVGRTYKLKDFLRYGYVVHGNTLMVRRSLPSTLEERERLLKLKQTAPTMVDVIERALMYDQGKIFVFPDVFLAHRSGDEAPTSFSYQHSRHMQYYTEMYSRIVNALNEYFNGKYNFNPLLSSKIGADMFCRLRARKKMYSAEFCEYWKTLPRGVRLMSYERLAQKYARGALHRIGNCFRLYIDNQESRDYCK